MAWTTPKTWTTGEVLTAANLNTHLRDNLQYAIGTDNPHCRVYRSTTQSISNSSTTVITFDSERVDVGGLHSTVTNTSRVTVPSGAGGWWVFGCNVGWSANTTGRRECYILTNGAGASVGGDIRSAAADFPTHNIEQMCTAVAGDYMEVAVSQNSGGSLTVAASVAWSPEFWARWMGT